MFDLCTIRVLLRHTRLYGMRYEIQSKFLTISIFVVAMISFYPITSVLAHNFYNNKDSIFFTLVKQFQVEEKLASEDMSKNKTLALKHSENAAGLFKQLLSLNNQAGNNSTITNQYNNNIFARLNTTTKALVVANLADQSLKQYGMAKGLNPSQASGLVNMSMSTKSQMNRPATMNMTGIMPSQNSDMVNLMSTNHQSLIKDNNDVINQDNYETSTMLAKALKMVFTNNLQNASLQKSSGLMHLPTSIKLESVKNLGQGIDNLLSALNGNRTLPEVYSIVHGQIHPHLFIAYDLKLKSE
jgi:hypothetical protein